MKSEFEFSLKAPLTGTLTSLVRPRDWRDSKKIPATNFALSPSGTGMSQQDFYSNMVS